MRAICELIVEQSKPLVLKGGTALMLCYELDRFSEDLDFDLQQHISTHLNIESLCRDALKRVRKSGLKLDISEFKEPKKTSTTHRCRIAFMAPDDPVPISLKLEISGRETIDQSAVQIIHGIKVYSPNEIARQKLLAATEDPSRNYRTAARDLHDMAYLVSSFPDALGGDTQARLDDFFAEPEALLERYESAYIDDALLADRLYEDIATIEGWNHRRNTQLADKH